VAEGSDVDEGYFPEGSMLREVHSQRAVGLHYGLRGLAIGALHPLTYIGTATHTRNPEKPFTRLANTATMFEIVMFGSKQEADKVLKAVARMHKPVEGSIPKAAGEFSAGTRYSAVDPELMLWTLAVIADSGMYFYELLVRKLSFDEKERLWQDYVRFGELFGMKKGTAPKTYTEFRQWFDGMLNSPKMHLTEGAKEMGLAIAFDTPLSWYAYPYKRFRNALMRGSLPRRVRELYGIEYSARHAAEFAAAVTWARVGDRVAPASLKRGRNAYLYSTVKATERKRLRDGKPTAKLTL
jgi:uncharacterized protein (DUF2236 family)